MHDATSVLLSLGSSDDQQFLDKQNLSLPLTDTRDFDHGFQASSPCSGQDTCRGLSSPTQHARHGRSRVRKRPLLVYLAITVSIIIILLSLEICRGLLTRDRLSAMAYRRLSDGGEGIDEHDRSIIETCLDLESDMGLLEQRVTSSSTTDASARLTELVSMLSGAAAATGSVEGRLLPGEGEAHSREQLLEDQSGSEHEGGGPVGLHTSSMQALEERGEFISGVLPSLDPDSWMDAIPSIQSQPEDEEIRESSWIPGDEGEAELASTSLLSKDGHTEDPGNQYVPGDIRTHPYVRLPVLEKRVFPRYIRVSNLFVRRSWRFSPNSCLLTLRHLFAKETLNQKDADMVMNAVERLVTICWLRSSRPPRRLNPLCVVELLGYYFMAFDAIVCAIELFKDSMLLYRWWDKFTARFHLDLPATPPWVSFTPLAAYNRELILRLIRALKIYRTGKRPPLAEVVALKRLLFCSPHGRHRLKGPKWDPWRKDGMCP